MDISRADITNGLRGVISLLDYDLFKDLDDPEDEEVGETWESITDTFLVYVDKNKEENSNG